MKKKKVLIIIIAVVVVFVGIVAKVIYDKNDPNVRHPIEKDYEERDISQYTDFNYDDANNYFAVHDYDLKYLYNNEKYFSRINVSFNNNTSNSALLSMYDYELTDSNKEKYSYCYMESNLQRSVHYVFKPDDILHEKVDANSIESGYLYCELLEGTAKYLKITNYKSSKYKDGYKIDRVEHFIELK